MLKERWSTKMKTTSVDYAKAKKNFKAMSILQYGIGSDEYSRILACSTAKDIWGTLELTHEGTNEVKQSRIDLLVQQYELFTMNKEECIKEMLTQFTLMTNELHSLGKTYTFEDLVRKVLRSLTNRCLP